MSKAAKGQIGMSRAPLLLSLLALLIPYSTVGAGLYVFHNAWAAILGYHIGIVALLWLGRYAPARERLRFHWPALGFGALGFLGGASLLLLWPYLGLSPDLPPTLIEWGLTRETWPIFIAYSALVNPALEELYWRDWLGSDARRLCGTTPCSRVFISSFSLPS
jgi:membrane protease YdiL (CAAX protease family)